jgi:hypothetical protein
MCIWLHVWYAINSMTLSKPYLNYVNHVSEGFNHIKTQVPFPIKQTISTDDADKLQTETNGLINIKIQ